jgi:hypothetical protein
MFTTKHSERVLARVVAGLAISAALMVGAIAHTVLASVPLV